MGDWVPDVEIDMLVRRPAAEVYAAFADPEQVVRFWLASASGPLETGATVHWAFKVAGAETDVEVVAAHPGELLDLRWDEGQPVRVELEARGEHTLVAVRVAEVDRARAAIDLASGFTLVLASLKLWLEHGIAGELMYDKHPDAAYADR
jgi:uncharacterized protein YndB with AHSA1/START domain